MNNRDELTIEICIIQTVKWAENKLVEFHTLAQRKDLQFFDNDPHIQEVLNDAATLLNKTGGLSFKKSLDLLKQYEGRLHIDTDGVREVFGGDNDETKVYSSSENTCNCTRWMQDRCPCRHILFFRKTANLPLLDVSTFAEFYLKETENALDKEDFETNSDTEDVDQNNKNEDNSIPDSDEEQEEYILEPQEKFRVANDMLKELGDLLCHFGTPQFRQYMWELELIKRRVRRGCSMIGNRKTVSDNKKSEIVPSTSEDDLGETVFTFKY